MIHSEQCTGEEEESLEKWVFKGDLQGQRRCAGRGDAQG